MSEAVLQRPRRTRPAPVKHRLQFAVLGLLGVLVMLYPMTASWFSQLNQSQLIDNYSVQVDEISELVRAEALAEAHTYNQTLQSGAAFDPFTRGLASVDSQPYQNYLSILEGVPTGVMARIVIPEINVDLPIYHGTSAEVLDKGVGHLYGTALPVGGKDTHSVLTAHSGLAEAVLFTHLDKLNENDIFTIETYGENFTYQVRRMDEVLPHETESLIPEAGRDLLTLVTCTPIGVNSHRLLVTAERIPNIEGPEQYPLQTEQPGFPWWAVYIGAAVILAALFVFGPTWWRKPRRSV
ncbi:MAG TPA: class C sortase [Enteractinococcus helveticum]|uniref:Class C sortase n=1 Tax=Enteractinococcus helveticum TaxID=1837282 RepID=A0A921FNU0_9MICC|nr:class C sortase [Enteractinococcus helveticum]HJF15498.1 class C sortase [Enteractinococcus helveticum]